MAIHGHPRSFVPGAAPNDTSNEGTRFGAPLPGCSRPKVTRAGEGRPSVENTVKNWREENYVYRNFVEIFGSLHLGIYVLFDVLCLLLNVGSANMHTLVAYKLVSGLLKPCSTVTTRGLVMQTLVRCAYYTVFHVVCSFKIAPPGNTDSNSGKILTLSRHKHSMKVGIME